MPSSKGSDPDMFEPKGDESNPWTFLSETEIHTSPWINLYTHQVLNCVRREQTYNVVRFQNKAVGVIPLHVDGTITLVGQYRYVPNYYSWEIPEGGCPHNEDLLDCAKRELQEETGLRALRFDRLLEMYLSNSVTDEFAVVYLAQGLTEGEASPEENEVLQTRRVTLAEIIDDINAGQITDAITIAAIQKLEIMRLKGELQAWEL